MNRILTLLLIIVCMALFQVLYVLSETTKQRDVAREQARQEKANAHEAWKIAQELRTSVVQGWEVSE